MDLDDYSGIFVGGGPFNASDPYANKSPVQRRVEAEFQTLLDEVVARDFPFLGACYGIGTLGVHQGAVIDRTYREPISVVELSRTEAGASDPLLADVPDSFTAFVGHKEAVTVLPRSATLLASGEACPVQMFRVGQQRLRDPVPPRARRRRHHDADPRVRRPRLFRARRALVDPGRRAAPSGHAHRQHPAGVRPALRALSEPPQSSAQPHSIGGVCQILSM